MEEQGNRGAPREWVGRETWEERYGEVPETETGEDGKYTRTATIRDVSTTGWSENSHEHYPIAGYYYTSVTEILASTVKFRAHLYRSPKDIQQR